MDSTNGELRVTEIYPSIQGESTHAGRPCVFIRLTGCPLRCRWCDTVYAFREGEARPIDAIVDEACALGLDTVEVTGGEPLAQKQTAELLRRLTEHFATVLLETSGTFPIEGLDPAVHIIMDLKAPGSGEERKNHWENLAALKDRDELKIVIADRNDYEWARDVVRERPIPPLIPVHFSPAHGEIEPEELASWILEDRLSVRLHLQQHKYIWDPQARGV